MTASSKSRHMSKQAFESFLLASVPFDIPVEGDPALTLFIRPARAEVGLRAAPVNMTDSRRRLPQSMAVRSVYVDGRARSEVVLSDPSLFIEGYGLLCAIADRVQLDAMSLPAAIDLTVRNLRTLLGSGTAPLKKDEELGLLGELLVLHGLLDLLGEQEAMSAWRGLSKSNAEHDFGLEALDIEVKTTSMESRVHHISSATQLMPSAGRPLWLVSNQLSEAGSGYGRSLREFVEDLRSRFTSVEQRVKLEVALKSRGWPWPDAEFTRWIYRTHSRIYAVDGDFPRVTNELMTLAKVDVARLRGLTYQIDLTEYRSNAEPPAKIDSLITNLGEL